MHGVSSLWSRPLVLFSFNTVAFAARFLLKKLQNITLSRAKHELCVALGVASLCK